MTERHARVDRAVPTAAAMPIIPEHEHTADQGLLAQSVVDPALTAEHDRHLRTRRCHQRIAAITVALVAFLAIAGLAAQVGFSDTKPTSGAAPSIAVKADAVGVLVIRPGRDPERVAAATPVAGGLEDADAASATWELPGIATVTRVATNATVAPADRSAASRTAIEAVSLFGGRIEIRGGALAATAGIRDARAAGSLRLASSTRLLVDGAPRPAGVNERIAVEDIGTVIVNEQAVLASAPTGDAQTGPRHRVVGAIAHVRLTAAVGDLPVGTELIIGRVDAGVRQGRIREVAHAKPGSDTVPPPLSATPGASAPAVQVGTPRPGDAVIPRRPVGIRGGGSASAGGYQFPVLGTSSYTDTWGAARASTGVPHQGTDIFATEGTPLVAVADGYLERVGWNTIGGYRLWLHDGFGNAFYYAHLGAFSPLAADGVRVRRGDVIGFVGHTGDAQGTPPHLHFEVHPGNGAATNPVAYLNGWKRGVAVAIGLLAGSTERIAPLALLGFSDITASSGLQDSVLDAVPDTAPRPVDQERTPRPTDETLREAIDGPGINAG
ncbi:MAG: metalloendopeptidase-like rane protein [Thermoleophilia bacterium]|nr:metalloendopeptidase-like rane protein [Thermoleophilia bacterium]